MKNIILTSMAFLVLFVCCKKADDNEGQPPSSEKFPIHFTVAGFNQEIEDFDKQHNKAAPGQLKETSDSLTEHINYLYYVVFNADNTEIPSKIYQTAGDEGFGIINDTLQAGSYVIAIVGSKDPVTLNSYPDGSDPRYLVLDLPGTDVFYTRVPLNIAGPVNQILNLDRIVAKLKLIVKDRIPYNAELITLVPYKEPPGLSEFEDPGYPNTLLLKSGQAIESGGPGAHLLYGPLHHYFTPAEKGALNFSLEAYLLMMKTDTVILGVTAGDDQNRGIANKMIYGIRMEPSKRTVLSGELFDGQPATDTGVNVTITHPEWQSDSILVNF